MDVSLSFPTIHESFNRENSTFSNSRKFLPAKVSRYTVVPCIPCNVYSYIPLSGEQLVNLNFHTYRWHEFIPKFLYNQPSYSHSYFIIIIIIIVEYTLLHIQIKLVMMDFSMLV